MASETFDDLNEQMLLRLLSTNPDCATVFGRHDPYDRQLPHGGYRKIGDNLSMLVEWAKVADEIASRDDLPRDREVSLRVLRFTLDTYRFAVEDYPLWRMRPEALETPGTAMLMMLVRDYAPLAERLESLAARVGELPRYLEQFRGRFAGSRCVRIWTEAALESCRGFPSFLDAVLKIARASAGIRAKAEMERNAVAAKEELRAHEAWLSGMLDSSVNEFAMGRASYTKLMRIRGIPFTPDELLELAERHMDESARQREAVAKRIVGSGTVDDARKIVESEHPGNMDDVVRRTEATVERAMRFVIEKDLATVPPGSRVHVMKTPEFLRDSTTSAATYLPAVFEQIQDTVFLITGTDDPAALGRAWNHSAIDDTVVHEAYPGHHYQGVMSNKMPWMHQLPHIMYTSETLSPPYESQEGWATYCESMMQEKGFLGSDWHALGMLDYAIWTACRTIAEVKLSCGDATVEEMIDMTVRESGSPRAYAEADVKGFTRMPGYGMCYLVGRHLVTALKRDLREELGAGFSEKRFHDLVAGNGNLPFHLLEAEVRAGMRGHA
ncbi:MAG: hypothetical protein A3K67_02465 [Euryarchaeota archaeon RBG_16_62_10]|nr:MAG: hypothetical protein A3K67_02465 [Euryarchaeota archaeon RBG_16_62_10]